MRLTEVGVPLAGIRAGSSRRPSIAAGLEALQTVADSTRPGCAVRPLVREARRVPGEPVQAVRPVSSFAAPWALSASSTALKACSWVIAFSVRFSTSSTSSPKKG